MLNAAFDNWLNCDEDSTNYDGMLCYIAWSKFRRKLFCEDRIKINNYVEGVNKNINDIRFPGFIGKFFILTQLQGYHGCISRFYIFLDKADKVNFNVNKICIPHFSEPKPIPGNSVREYETRVKEYEIRRAKHEELFSRIEITNDVADEMENRPNILGKNDIWLNEIRKEIKCVYEKLIKAEEHENEKLNKAEEEKRKNDEILKNRINDQIMNSVMGN